MDSENLLLSKTSHSLGHRRQASKGLGIITNSDTLVNSETKNTTTTTASVSAKSTKNASFFETSDIETPQPPPRLRPLDIFKDAKSPTVPTPLEPSTSYASRLRNIVATSKNHDSLLSTSYSLTPTPSNDNESATKASTETDQPTTMQDTTNMNQAKVRRARSYRFRPPYNSHEDIDDDDGIMPLPSPLPTSTTSSNRLPHEHHHVFHPTHNYISSSSKLGSAFDKKSSTSTLIPEKITVESTPHSPMTPPSPSTSTSIPILAISPTFVHRNDVIPQLSEHPMLGDIDDRMLLDHHASQPLSQRLDHCYETLSNLHKPTSYNKLLVGNMVRESSQSTSLPNLDNDADEDLIDKQLGHFYIRRLLGMGAFSKVYLAERHPGDGDQKELFAIKTINKVGMLKNPRVRSSIEREVAILKFIDHPHIVHIEATMETEHSLCIILEYAQGVELFDFVQKLHERLHTREEAVDEKQVKQIFLQLVGVVKWMHQHNIVHRDLKLENILIHMDDQGEPILKVTDFGLARVIDPESPILTTRCGSEEYAAPEIVQSKGYDGRQTDTWALGVILYSLLVGYLPFRYDPSKGERVTQMFYRIVRAQVKWPKAWDHLPHLAISTQAKIVVEKILIRQPEHRIRLDDIDHLPWFQSQ